MSLPQGFSPRISDFFLPPLTKCSRTLYGVKDPIPGGLRSRFAYKFACAGCNVCYVGETTRNFSTRLREHLVSDKDLHIFKHLRNSEHRHALCSVDFFHLFLDHTFTGFQLKIKEAFHIQKENKLLESAITSCKFKTILLILALSRLSTFRCY